MSYTLINNPTGSSYGTSLYGYTGGNNIRGVRGPIYTQPVPPIDPIPLTPVPTVTELKLVSGQKLPPVGQVLYYTSDTCRFWEEKEMTTLFGVDGKTKDECSRKINQAVGKYTGRHFAKLDPFGRISLYSIEVDATFPFDREGKAAQTTIPLWVDSFLKYNEEGVIENPTGPGATDTPYQMDENGNIIQGQKPGSETENKNTKYWIIGILLIAFLKIRK